MSAIFSECGKYRYRLERHIGEGPPLGFILHNPSTAGATADDATSRRGIGFARDLGYGRLIFVNPWAWVATKPRELWGAEDAIGPENDAHIRSVVAEVSRNGGMIIAAWGRISPPAAKRTQARARIASLVQLIEGVGSQLYALGVNKDRSPKHPLYVKTDAKPLPWSIYGDSHAL
ncbi:DUF1643 domain-containing protein [Mesorhizobium sp. M5C.F.Ca.IN.020.29.1.1]|uniref:DUF1643 domain-containing protein n=1 Tax=Mesorhizobium sp. TaxID=1871066 RepID=UPI000FCA0EC0|nr:DUF1643 domain-containing protein [Mesorhizobium sp. M5C.F.Ca.IN.020.29.1.1]TIM84364.1 MAG: DUF1643 domain-containing protein [Mesorhizobium sp.]